MNRYFSMSRRSSLFFGSHKGAERAAVLYTLALSAKMNRLNLFGYLVDILDRTAKCNLIRHWENTGIYYLTAGNHPQKTNETEQASSLAQFFCGNT